jgi:predicted small metal-binding protein
MTYKATCVQTDCEFFTQTETEQEAIEAINHHTNEAHASMDILGSEVRENISRVE